MIHICISDPVIAVIQVSCAEAVQHLMGESRRSEGAAGITGIEPDCFIAYLLVRKRFVIKLIGKGPFLIIGI